MFQFTGFRGVACLFLLGCTLPNCPAQDNVAHRNELAFGLSAVAPLSRSDVPQVKLGVGTALQVNYGRRILGGSKAALYSELHFLASPRRQTTSNVTTASRDIASLYLTPGLRLKLFPGSRLSPYLAGGGGYAQYEQSRLQLDGSPNMAPRTLSRGALDVAAGADLRVWRWIAARGEIRDFYTGSPGYNVPSLTGGQHNVILGGGLVIRWH